MRMGRRVWPLERLPHSQHPLAEVDRFVVVAVDREEKDLVEKDRSPAEGEGKGRSDGEHTRVRGKRRRAPAAMDGG